jgi:Tfp pilus assembly protein PilX
MKSHFAVHQVPTGRRQGQRGIVLYVALVVMIAMMLAGVAMLRSVGAGVGVAGNLSFKQNATLAGDRGTEMAIAWLTTRSALQLEVDDTAHGYFATWDTGFDPANTFDWSGAAVQVATNDDGAGNAVRYVIHRLCKNPGSALSGMGQECAVHGDICTNLGAVQTCKPSPPVFRVTSRTVGPRDTTSYVQVVVY